LGGRDGICVLDCCGSSSSSPPPPLACLLARPAKTRTNTETKNEKKEKNKRKNEKKSGAIGISPLSHSMMLPGYTNLGGIIRWHITLHKTHTDHQFINGLL